MTSPGRWLQTTMYSPALEGNALGDPADRPIEVYLPPGYDDDPARRYPTVYVLQGYLGRLGMWHAEVPWRDVFPDQVDRLFTDGLAALGRQVGTLDDGVDPGVPPPCVVVLVDAWTSVGGSQYVDSPGTGRYGSYVCDDVIGWVDEHVRTIAAPASRAVTGKSSGGFGAMILPMQRPDVFGALASHAGDTLYEYCYLPSFSAVVRALRRFDHSVAGYLADLATRPALTQSDDAEVISTWGVAACFSADPDGTPVLPFDTATGVLDESRWQRWLDLDPVRMVPGHAEALRGLRGIWVDAGTRDDYHLDLGGQAFLAALAGIGVAGAPGAGPAMHSAFYEATHANINHRYPQALAWLASVLEPGTG